MSQSGIDQGQKFNNLYQTVFLHLSEGVIIHDHRGKIVQFNPATLKILGLTEQQLLGKDSIDPLWQVYDFEGTLLPQESLPVEISLRSGKSCENVTIGLALPNQELKWILVNSNPIFSDSGLIAFVVVTFKDITQKSKLRNQQMIELTQSALGEFSSGILHNLNNPVSVISGHTQQLLKSIEMNRFDLSETQLKLESIRRMTGQMSKMISSFKKFARDGHLDEMELVNIHELIDEVIEVCRYQLTKNQVVMEINIEETFNFYCRMTDLLQVLVNLVANSIDALEQSQKKVIQIQAQENKGKILISVIDHGLGIESQNRQNIFEAFFSTKKNGHGAGIGLFHSKKTIESHGGRLWLDEITEWTQFNIELPADKK